MLKKYDTPATITNIATAPPIDPPTIGKTWLAGFWDEVVVSVWVVADDIVGFVLVDELFDVDVDEVSTLVVAGFVLSLVLSSIINSKVVETYSSTVDSVMPFVEIVLVVVTDTGLMTDVIFFVWVIMYLSVVTIDEEDVKGDVLIVDGWLVIDEVFKGKEVVEVAVVSIVGVVVIIKVDTFAIILLVVVGIVSFVLVVRIDVALVAVCIGFVVEMLVVLVFSTGTLNVVILNSLVDETWFAVIPAVVGSVVIVVLFMRVVVNIKVEVGSEVTFSEVTGIFWVVVEDVVCSVLVVVMISVVVVTGFVVLAVVRSVVIAEAVFVTVISAVDVKVLIGLMVIFSVVTCVVTVGKMVEVVVGDWVLKNSEVVVLISFIVVFELEVGCSVKGSIIAAAVVVTLGELVVEVIVVFVNTSITFLKDISSIDNVPWTNGKAILLEKFILIY